ncbi:MAG: lipid-A-disaccharide synthase [Armatimonadota bacterium]|nr:lipid-A-disaccharide synthase [Armatimonadota bacterium]
MPILEPGRAAGRVFIVAGEVSGDLHGAALARELRALDPGLRLEGIGGLRMAAAGVRLVEDSSTWGLMGWAEAVHHMRAFLRRLDAATSRLLADPPDVLVLVDFPGFNLRLLERLGGRIPAVYYVPPMVSIRRGRRAARIAALGARLLAIFPFEAEAYRAAGADVTFVGHPAVDLADGLEPAARVRARLGIPPDGPVLGLLPGSRRQELDALADLMLDAARRVRAAHPHLVVLLAVASPIFRDRIGEAVAASRLPVILADGARQVMQVSTVLLLASGTAAVEAMVLGVPMVAVYRGSWVSWMIANLVVAPRWGTIPNIMARAEVVPELLQARANARMMSAAVRRLLCEPQARDAMRARLLALASTLGPPGAARRAAAEVLAAMGRPTLKVESAVQ